MTEKELNKIIAENIDRLLRATNRTQLELGEYIGVTQATISNWCNGVKVPRMDKIDKICEFFSVKRSAIMEDYRVNGFSETSALRIPVFGSVPAGIPMEAIEDIVDYEEIPSSWTNGDKEYFALRVKGDSMSPKYLDGDTIILEKCVDAESGSDCVVYVNGYDATLKKVIKKMDCVVLQPLNPIYDPVIYDNQDADNPVKIVGKVVELRRKI